MKSQDTDNRSNVPSKPQGRDLTKGNILRSLLVLSWPVVIGGGLNIIGPLVDMVWVGRLGTNEIAAVGASGNIVMMLNALTVGVFIGMRTMAARYFGAKDHQNVVHVAQQAITIGFVLSLVLLLVGIFLSKHILTLLGVSDQVLEIGTTYLQIELIGMMGICFRSLTDSMMQATGDTVNPMKIAVVFRGLHVALCPLLIFGWGFIPAMGVIGAALSGVITQLVGTVLAFWILMTGRSRIKLTFMGFHLHWPTIWRILKIGIPSSIMSMQSQIGQLAIMGVVASFGTIALATHTLCARIDMVLYLPLMGIGTAAGIMIGQNLGAGQQDRAAKIGWTAVFICEIFLITVASLLLIWPEFAIKLFNSDPELIKAAVPYLRIALIGCAVMAFTNVLQNCLWGAGDTLPPMIISVVTVWGVQVPLSIFLSGIDSLNMYGVRLAISIAFVLSAIFYATYFKLGRWKRVKV